ncbi:rhomboid family intramembrane serine protease [Marinomonas sp. 2405UD68-3]|uniref:rhomboid family intramembrane serine protease n=1 Tax=Marinomonas sp. 2405UD68-3 TaxID=3391835 RepID=UPI0039C9ADAA
MHLMYRFLENQKPEDLSRALWRHKVGHRIVSNNGNLELWLVDDNDALVAEQLIRSFELGMEELATSQNKEAPEANFPNTTSPTRSFTIASLWLLFKLYPIVFSTVVITLCVCLITQLGDNYVFLGWFTITPLIIENNYLYSKPLSEMNESHAYWRLLTPVFLHFSIMHLVFNLLWIWEIGRKLEKLIGSILWSVGFIIIGVASNIFQYWDTQSPLFGGLSGVVYGCIGFAWVIVYVNPNWPSLINKGLMVFFLVWLGIGYTDIPESLGLGNMANTAHLVGLVSGSLLAVVYGLLSKNRTRRA